MDAGAVDEVCHYVVVRDDVPTGIQLAMCVHAAGASAQLLGARSAAPPTTAVALAASDDELLDLHERLAESGIPHVVVREPDEQLVAAFAPRANCSEAIERDRDVLMAIGVVPMARARVRRLLAHLPLVRGKADRE